MFRQYEYTNSLNLFIFMDFSCISGRRCVDIQPFARVLAASKRKSEQSCFHLISPALSAPSIQIPKTPFSKPLSVNRITAICRLLQCGEHLPPIRSRTTVPPTRHYQPQSP